MDALEYRVEAGQVIRALFGFAADLEHPADALEQLADQAAAAIKPPRLTGALAADVTAEVTNGRAGARLTKDYAGPINYGWPARNIAPANFLAAGDAVLQNRSVRLLKADLTRTATKRGLT